MGAKWDFFVKVLRFVFGNAFKVSGIGLNALYNMIQKVGIVRLLAFISVFSALIIPLQETIQTGEPVVVSAGLEMFFKGELKLSDMIEEMQVEGVSDKDKFLIGLGVLGYLGLVYYLYEFISVYNRWKNTNTSMGGIGNIIDLVGLLIVIECGYLLFNPDGGYTLFKGFKALYHNFSFYVESMSYPVDLINALKEWIFGIPDAIIAWKDSVILWFSNIYHSIPFIG